MNKTESKINGNIYNATWSPALYVSLLLVTY